MHYVAMLTLKFDTPLAFSKNLPSKSSSWQVASCVPPAPAATIPTIASLGCVFIYCLGLQADISAADATEQLRQQGINTWITPLTTTRIAFEARGIKEDLVRLSVHYYNTEEEVRRVVAAVAALKPSSGSRAGLGSALWLLLGSGVWSRSPRPSN